MAKELKNRHEQYEGSVRFSPIKLRYVASCYPFLDRIGVQACQVKSSWIRENLLRDPSFSCEFSHEDIAEPYPHLARLLQSGVFQHISPQQYFEGLEFPFRENTIVFHNPGLYLFAKSSLRKGLPGEVFQSIFDHIEGCSVKPARCIDRTTAIVTAYSGDIEAMIDLSLLSCDSPTSRFILVHGFSSDSVHCGIRYVTKDEYERFCEWFKERQLSKENPFRRL
ncbi:MAG: hypothetical protein N3A54_02925 [Patescibacteria group bacterium]|nr:hypothetical protein [Patescibacteria group bacterium]